MSVDAFGSTGFRGELGIAVLYGPCPRWKRVYEWFASRLWRRT